MSDNNVIKIHIPFSSIRYYSLFDQLIPKTDA